MADETPVTIKTRAELYPRVEAIILASHPYELPEIVAVPISHALLADLDWIAAENCRRGRPRLARPSDVGVSLLTAPGGGTGQSPSSGKGIPVQCPGARSSRRASTSPTATTCTATSCTSSSSQPHPVSSLRCCLRARSRKTSSSDAWSYRGNVIVNLQRKRSGPEGRGTGRIAGCADWEYAIRARFSVLPLRHPKRPRARSPQETMVSEQCNRSLLDRRCEA